jgi:ubiquinone/menaquinone biosynthesis C-methylase UbiE
MQLDTNISKVAAIPDLPLAECLEIVSKVFDIDSLSQQAIDQASVLDYYRQSDRGYRLFHSKAGAMHVGLNRSGEFSTEVYLGQVDLIGERIDRLGAKRVLEIGCGFGYNTRNLAERHTGCNFVGVDMSENHIKQATRESKRLPHLDFELGNFQELRFGDCSFDVVCAVECLCQCSDMQQAMREAWRVLRPGGRLVVIDCFRDAPLEDYDEAMQMAVRLVEKTTAVDKFSVLDLWCSDAEALGFLVREKIDLSAETSHNLARLYSLSRRFFKMPFAARAFLKAFPQRLLENSVSGMLMPFTVGRGAHRYCLIELERS